MEITPEQRVWDFLAEEVPGHTSDEGPQLEWWKDWNERCRNLPLVAPAIFIQALKEKPSRFHYAAVIGLRHHGYEAWAHGFGMEIVFRIRRVGSSDWETIVPRYPDDYQTDILHDGN